MTITIQRPEIEALIQERLQKGSFRDAEDVVFHALVAFETLSMFGESATDANNLVELFEPVRGLLTDEEIDAMFRRDCSLSRPDLDLS